jgi:hypothetical protein
LDSLIQLAKGDPKIIEVIQQNDIAIEKALLAVGNKYKKK